MNAALLILGALTMSQSESPLALEATSTGKGGDFLVTARLRNRGKAPCAVALEEYWVRLGARLIDAKGKELEFRHLGAARGGAGLPAEGIKITSLAPGAAVDVMTFSLLPEMLTASAGDFEWQLQNVAGQTLQVEFTLSYPDDLRAEAERRAPRGTIFGTWSSPKVDVATPTLTQKRAEKVLAAQRTIVEPAAVPLLVKALREAKDPIAREYAAVSLGELKAGAAALAEALREDKVREVRLSAAASLAQLAAPETRKALTEAAEKDPDDLVRTRAKDALSKLPQ